MPIIQVQVIKGRSVEQIRDFIAHVTEVAAKDLEVNPEQVRVIVTEIEDTHWGAGGLPIKEYRRQKALEESNKIN
ncbi:2-hydroxymuconate tautomerase family protein [Sporosarcina sp. ACRSM]|uniref:2-hydroxymuconate tautomerase family protein n=1 Tax=Sporosarcina sp. ACRSM TaxID=2918216 RepID=UPI001EF661F0|nr:2-hydroxymuconate tautomerase family protein [Sporosarcina sp. ACRSM]MCG7335830.1 2-hydroxymuconate tautomerase family protein [Sporosarcina sp. ACRSM]